MDPPLSHTYCDWKSILIIWQDITARRLQKFQFSNFLLNWKIFGSTASAIIQNSQFSISFMNSVKLETTAEDKHLKTQILTIWMNWEKLCPNLSLLENEIGNLHKPSWSHNWSHFKVNIMNDVFSNFKNQSMNCDKYAF